MCGFLTVLNPPNISIDPEGCRRATNLLFHRGPDSYGEWIDSCGEVYMGFRRLSIIDLSDEANQPMVSESNNVIVFNGEIYNFEAIREKLKSQGGCFHTSSDTEVLLKAFEKWGMKCLNELEGMFAFVYYETATGKAHICRDQFGIKPLYIYQSKNGGLYISSEIKAFYELPDFVPEFNNDALPEYLMFRSLCGSQTLLKGVFQVEPGQLIEYHRLTGVLNKHTYWSLNDQIDNGLTSKKNDTTEILLNKFKETVERHLIADVPVGTQFSGGIDSGLISAIASRDLGKELTGYHCIVKDSFFDETPYADGMASWLGMPKLETSTFCSEVFFSDLLEKLTWHMDEPLGHPSAMGVYLISKKAKSNVKVLLSGEGADEFFAGYYRYPRLNLSEWFRHKTSWLGKFGQSLHIKSGKLKTLTDIIVAGQTTTSDHEIVYGNQFIDSNDFSVLMPGLNNKHKCIQQRLIHLKEFSNCHSVVEKCQLFDIKTYLPSLLIRQDKMSMAASIENRVPFITPLIFKLAMNLPDSQRCNMYQRKVLLHKYFNKYFPHKFSQRPKMGFGIPLGKWFTEKLGKARLDLLLEKNNKIYSVIDYKTVEKLVNTFDGSQKTAETLWILLSLSVWMEIFLSPKVKSYSSTACSG